jgi:AraC family transcriptional regulator
MEQRLATKEDYLKRVNNVIEYINNHLNEDIDLEKLADISNFSKWHFQRIMKAFLGEPIGAFIQRVRVETAAKLLRYSKSPISEIAYEVGYDTPSSLSKVFQSFYGISPSEYRNNKNYAIMKPIQLNEHLDLKTPKIVDLEPIEVIYLKLTGNYKTLDFCGAWSRLWQFVKENKLYSAGIEHIGIYHDDPKVTEESKLRTDLCLALQKKAEPKGEIGVKTIEGGKYAKFLYTGPYEHLGAVYDTIYGKWLPESGNCSCEDCSTPYSQGCEPECNCGCILRNAPCFEKYINNPDKTPSEKLKTEIYVPIK